MNPVISIITPCYNSEKYISETIKSVLSQTFTDWEWIIVDDCSKDNSIQSINDFQDERISLVVSDKNIGAAGARNLGIEKAKGRYLAFLDSDDIWKENYLESSLDFIRRNKYEFIFSSYERRDENMKPLLNPFIVPESLTFKSLLYHCPIFTSTVLYDSRRIGKIYYPIVDKREDHAFYLNLLQLIPKAYGITNPDRVWYRIHQNSYSRNKIEIARKQFMVYYKFLNLSLLKSTYYTVHWALNGLKKYEKFKLRNNS